MRRVIQQFVLGPDSETAVPEGGGNAAAEKFNDRGPNVIVPAGSVNAAYLADPPEPGVRRLEQLGVRITRV